jgi:radical SAM-linked protein
MKKQRFRIHFSKLKPMRYTGHLDLIQTWERIFRRGSIPLAYSEGYSPRPLINLAAPLPLGFISTGEIGDFWLSEVVSKSDLEAKLCHALPPGISIQEINEVQDLYGPKLPSLVMASSYIISIPGKVKGLSNIIGTLMASSQFILERKSKKYDLRKLIKYLELVTEKDQSVENIKMTLVTLPGAPGRPDEVCRALELKPAMCLICRTKIYLQGEEV